MPLFTGLSEARWLLILLGLALVGMLAARPVTSLRDVETRWAWGLWALTGMLLPVLEDPLLLIGIGLLWCSPVLATRQTRSIRHQVPGFLSTCPICSHLTLAATSHGAVNVLPAVIALAGGLVLIGLLKRLLELDPWTLRALLLSAGGLVLIVGLIEDYTGWFPRWAWFRPDRTMGAGKRNMQALLSNPAHFGALMALCVPAALAVSPWTALPFLAGAVLSASRVAVGASLIAWVPTAALAGPSWLLAGLLALPVAWAASMTWKYSLSTRKHIRIALSCLAYSWVDARYALWATILRHWRLWVWTGVGLGACYQAVAIRHQGAETWIEAHNEWLQLAVDAGILAAVAVLAWYARTLWTAASWETLMGLIAAGGLSMVHYPLRHASTAPFVLYYVARALGGV